MCSFLSGCGGGKPDNISQEMYDAAIYVIEAADMYLNGESTYEETDKKLCEFNVSELIESRDLLVNASISNIRISLLNSQYGAEGTGMDGLMGVRDRLAGYVNYGD